VVLAPTRSSIFSFDFIMNVLPILIHIN
jgi:hypothetical protein